MRETITAITRSLISIVGVILTTLSAVTFGALFFVDVVGHKSGLYSGIIGYLIIPGIFVLGLVLIPLGVWLMHRRERRTGTKLAAPIIDLNKPETRRAIVVIALLTGANLIIVSVGTYKGVVVMDSTEFCGDTCHQVMAPEYTVYKRSPHSRVECTECHIGSGANWYAKSKLSGSWQLIATALDLYPRPIPTPLHNLRPARETCEQCHWPEKFVGERLRIFTHFTDDELAGERTSVLLMNVGGVRNGQAKGIHWHVDPRLAIRYRSDPKRRTIWEVELTGEDGGVQSYIRADRPEDGGVADWRTMDCVDCHNRPTHVYETPLREVEHAMEAGRLDKTLPFIKREALRILQESYASHDDARTAIPRKLVAFYEKAYPEASKVPGRIEASAAELVRIYTTNVFPEMKIEWGTYQNFLTNHDDEMGCFRCHDNEHKTKDGRKISKGCSLCHEVLATEEENPEILEELHP